MVRKVSASRVYTMETGPVVDGVVVYDAHGTVMEVGTLSDYDAGDVERLEGAIIPGFVNTHCHLELSHMLGKVDTGTGLIPFISSVVQYREAREEIIQDAIRTAEDQMIESGIVAVGDISNTSDTFAQKALGRLRYYTFVEMFDFFQDAKAHEYFERYLRVYQELQPSGGSAKAAVPHSPYTVSRTLFELVNSHNRDGEVTVSIHNQEMVHENALFRDKSGDLLYFYEQFGFPLDDFEPIGAGSIIYALNNLDPRQRNMFVHNTLTTAEEIRMAQQWSEKVYWVTCPNANLYIENRLPDYRAFLDNDAHMTIGTDSLTSNWQLSVLDEIQTIARLQSHVPAESLLRWATINGAEALGFDDTLGSIVTGKRPGLLHLSEDPVAKGWAEVRVRRIV